MLSMVILVLFHMPGVVFHVELFMLVHNLPLKKFDVDKNQKNWDRLYQSVFEYQLTN
jgi:hypothetical protein